MLKKKPYLLESDFTNELTEFATELLGQTEREKQHKMCCYLCEPEAMHKDEEEKYGKGFVVCLRFPGFTIGHFYVDTSYKILGFYCYCRTEAYKQPAKGWEHFAKTLEEKYIGEVLEV